MRRSPPEHGSSSGVEVVADLLQAASLGGVDAEEGTSDAGVLVDAGF
jgi:hypothetical protein